MNLSIPGNFMSVALTHDLTLGYGTTWPVFVKSAVKRLSPNQPTNRAVTVFKPKTAVLRRNRTETEPRFSGGHVTVFL